MGRASTFFNTMRQVGSATGVAILSTVLIGVGSATAAGGTVVQPDITAYHFAFLTAAVFALGGVAFSLTIHDSDAAETIVRRAPAARARPAPAEVRGARGQRGVTPSRAVRVLRLEPRHATRPSREAAAALRARPWPSAASSWSTAAPRSA